MDRDLSVKPYTYEEARIAKYLFQLTGIGAGDDPVGFLIASHAALVEDRAGSKGQKIPDFEGRGNDETVVG